MSEEEELRIILYSIIPAGTDKIFDDWLKGKSQSRPKSDSEEG